ncbi:Actin, cytoplasmic-like protein [Mycena sanguinolenta]|uniref:Actin, cytoplasmic-like protein n=1 Tax=Mycena sanguinolenta TaxID=230812 RepID=A0A8H6XND4_9AGAR|nr:Actin, cytoplasmic-like protein [Mycena sanguinolenta]
MSIYDGLSIPHAIARLDVAVRHIKQNLRYVAVELPETAAPEKSCKLPDGRVLTFGNERYALPSLHRDLFSFWTNVEIRFRALEVPFKTSLLGVNTSGIHELILNSVMKCDLDIRQQLFTDVVLSGGATFFSRTSERMFNELRTMLPPDSKSDRQYAVWIDGSRFLRSTTCGSRRQSTMRRNRACLVHNMRVTGSSPTRFFE